MSADAAEPVARWKRRIPNALTVARVGLAVGTVAVLSAGVEGGALRLLLGASMFAAGAVTDALDGHFARRWNVITPFGRIMDPFADKLLVIGAFVCLAGPAFAAATEGGGHYQASGVAPWMVVAILGRELLVTSIRGVLEGRGVAFGATWSGKWKMILQSAAVPLILVLLASVDTHPGTWGRTVILVAVWSTLVVTLWSGVPYVVRAWGALREA